MDHSNTNPQAGLPPRHQLSSYDPAPEDTHGADTLPNPPRRDPASIGRYIDSASTVGIPGAGAAGASTPAIKLTAVQQLLIALGIVLVVVLGAVLWKVLSSGDSGGGSSTVAEQSAPTSAAAPSAVATTPAVPSAPATTPRTESGEGAYADVAAPPELISALPQELADNLYPQCTSDTAIGFLFGAEGSEAVHCIFLHNAQGPDSVIYSVDKAIVEGTAKKPIGFKELDTGLKAAPGRDVRVYEVFSGGGTYVVDRYDDKVLIFMFFEAGAPYREFMVEQGLATP